MVAILAPANPLIECELALSDGRDRFRLANQQRRLARRYEAVRRSRAKGRAGLVEVEGTEHVAMKKAVLAAAPVLAPSLDRALAAEPKRHSDLRRLLYLDQLALSE